VDQREAAEEDKKNYFKAAIHKAIAQFTRRDSFHQLQPFYFKKKHHVKIIVINHITFYKQHYFPGTK
jgi:hypothetical protein